MRLALLIACLLAGCVIAAPTHAQPAEWGDVPRRALEMNSYSADSNASAVVLSDVGTVHFDSRARLVYERHRRIKILTEGGYDWGTVELTYFAEDRMQRVTDIEGHTFTLAADGTVERHELDDDDVFREDINGTHERKRFTLPALEPGAVIEYRYEMRAKSPILMPEWTFQTDEPTLWSEYEVEIPNRFHFVQIVNGVADFHQREHDEVLGPMGSAQKYRWVMTDVPALRAEPFMTTPRDYQARIALQLKSYRTSRGHVEEFMSSWGDLAEKLLDRSDFGGQLDRGGDVRTRAELLVGDAQDPMGKMKAIYDYVRKKVEWNGAQGYIPGRDVDDVLEAQSGSSPEVALLLVAMMRNVGLDAYPVLISTRDHGKMQPVYPFLSQFNTTMAYVETPENGYLLDATDPQRPYDLLPERALNGVGWMVTDEGGQWLSITPGPFRRQTNVVGRLTADGTIEAQVQVSDANHSALQRRRKLKEQGAQAFIRSQVLDGLSDVEIQMHEIRNEAAVEEALTSIVSIRAAAYAQRAGPFLYVNPTLLDRRQENPLRAPTRTFPIDFTYPRDLSYIVSLELPDGYAVKDAPKNVQVKLPEQGGYFLRMIEVAHGRLTMRTRFLIARSKFGPEHYEALRAFYERVVAAQAEQLVLKRTATSEAAEEASAGGTGR